jgi:hypothetical protein
MALLPNLLTTLNVGSSPNDGTGDQLREGMIKINNNLPQILTRLGVGPDLQLRLDSDNSVVEGNVTGHNCQLVSLTLRPTGVVPGNYANPVNLVVDAKGRITGLSNINLPNGFYLIPSLTVSNGRISNITENAPNVVKHNDNAGGDLTGTYPNPIVKGLRTINISTTLPSITNQVYAFQNNEWVPKTLLEILPELNGDTQGPYNNNTVTRIRNRNVSGTQPTNRQVLLWVGSSNQWEPATLTPSDVGLGAAGGDLSGTYPNPIVVGLRTTPIANPLTPNPGDVLVWNGTSWNAASINAFDVSGFQRGAVEYNVPIINTIIVRPVRFSSFRARWTYVGPNPNTLVRSIRLYKNQIAGPNLVATVNIDNSTDPNVGVNYSFSPTVFNSGDILLAVLEANSASIHYNNFTITVRGEVVG